MSWSAKWKDMNPYDIHKMLVNEYVLVNKGDTRLLQRDSSRDKRDVDVLKEEHQFLWDENEEVNTWERRLAKKYYDRLFKEYCISDLTNYKENKVGLRWRTEKELIQGKGQFSCGEKHCSKSEGLRTWEVNFSYKEKGVKKNALVKLRLCPKCSKKLNYKFKKREIKRLKSSNVANSTPSQSSSTEAEGKTEETDAHSTGQNVWKNIEEPREEVGKTDGDQIDEFLEDLFL